MSVNSKLIFDINDLCKTYRVKRVRIPVLNGVNLKIIKGEWVALVGRSGSGKTTLLHLLGGLDRYNAGDVAYDGNNYSRISARKKGRLLRDSIGYLFQSYHLFPELTALENVKLPAMHWGAARKQAEVRAKELLIEFGLGERLLHRPQELSGGEQQRVALARALINNPDTILADEPTGNLDIKASNIIVDILLKLHREQGKTIVMVTHDLEMAKHANRIVMIKDGKAIPFDSQKF